MQRLRCLFQSLDGGKSFRLDSGGMLGLDADMGLEDNIDELNDETFGLAEDCELY